MAPEDVIQIADLVLTLALGLATIAIYLSLRSLQAKDAEANTTLARIAAEQNQQSQARFVFVSPTEYPFVSNAAENLSTHPAIQIRLANTGWKDSDILRAESTFYPAVDRGFQTLRPRTDIHRNSENRNDLHLPAGRTGDFVVRLEPKDLPQGFCFRNYHVRLAIAPVVGTPGEQCFERPESALPVPPA